MRKYYITMTSKYELAKNNMCNPFINSGSEVMVSAPNSTRFGWVGKATKAWTGSVNQQVSLSFPDGVTEEFYRADVRLLND